MAEAELAPFPRVSDTVGHMTFGIVLEKVSESELPGGYFYAHVPALGLTTHGQGIEGARAAALDLATLWIAEKRAAGEVLTAPTEFLLSTVEIEEDALQGA